MVSFLVNLAADDLGAINQVKNLKANHQPRGFGWITVDIFWGGCQLTPVLGFFYCKWLEQSIT